VRQIDLFCASEPIDAYAAATAQISGSGALTPTAFRPRFVTSWPPLGKSW
jgi:hypothetical protein